MEQLGDSGGFIRRLFFRHVWPNAAAQLVSTVGPIVCVTIAGAVFGKTGLAVSGLFSPFFFLAGFLGTVIASGSSALAAKYIARDDGARVSGIYTMSLIAAAGLTGLLCLVMTALREPLLNLLAGGGELLEPARAYYAPTVWYMFFTGIVYMPLTWARLTGKPNAALTLTLTMAVSGILFSAVFTFGLGLGLSSLAAGQALSTVLAAAVTLAMLHIPKNGLRLKLPKREHIWKDLKALTLAGSPLGLSRFYRFAGVFIINIILLGTTGGAEAVAVYGVLNTLLRFVTAFANGISATQMPIAGVLREERDFTSLKQLAGAAFACGNAGIIAAAVLMLLFRNPLAGVFGMEGGMFFTALVCFCVYIPFYMNGSMLISWYASVRQVAPANLVTLLQDMVLPPLFAFMLAGSGNVWLHLPVAGAVMVLLLPLITAGRGLSFPFLLEKCPGGTALAFDLERDAGKATEASAAAGDFCKEQGLEKKQIMLISLAIEEMVTLIARFDPAGGNISVRLTRFSNRLVLRLRDGGKKFNPIDYCKKRLGDAGDIEAAVDYMGVKYITEAAENVYYRETFGVNNLVIIL